MDRPIMKPIYVVVLVRYDWHRFQNNIYASDNIDDCIKVIEKNNSMNLKIYYYQDEKSNEAYNLSCEAFNHFWIQKFDI